MIAALLVALVALGLAFWLPVGWSAIALLPVFVASWLMLSGGERWHRAQRRHNRKTRR